MCAKATACQGDVKKLEAIAHLIEVRYLVEVRRNPAVNGEELAVDERCERERVERAHASFVYAVRIFVQTWKGLARQASKEENDIGRTFTTEGEKSRQVSTFVVPAKES